MGLDMSAVDRLADDLAAAPAKVEAECVRVVDRVAHQVQRDAQRFAPIRTGALREGITVETRGLSATITSTVDYADFVEYGTSKMAPEPYMRPAADLAEEPLANGAGDAGESIL